MFKLQNLAIIDFRENYLGSESVDIGAYTNMDVLDASTVSRIVKLGHMKIPTVSNIPRDSSNHSFPSSLLSYRYYYFF